MDVQLTRSWDGGRVQGGAGGRSLLVLRPDRLELSWNLRLAAPLSVPEGPRGFRDGLWEHDVVELFLRAGTADCRQGPYVEFEVAASGHWFAAVFSAPRQRLRPLLELEPRVLGASDATHWRGRAELPLGPFKDVVRRPPWKVLVAATLTAPADATGEARRLRLCWPALCGPSADFHQPERWAPFVPRT